MFTSNTVSKLIWMLLLFCSTQVLSTDIIKVNQGHSNKDTRHHYNWKVIKQALTLTEKSYGPFEFEVTGEAIPNHRRLKELATGRYLNVAMTITNDVWESAIEPIRVPIRFGAFKYRLLLINKNNVDAFSTANNVDNLKRFVAGVRQSWTTKDVLLRNNLDTVYAYSYEALFKMLNKGRFDYLLRGVHEIYPEYESRKHALDKIMIEPNLVVTVPNSFYYVFVSPVTPQINNRLSEGLKAMQTNGELKALFDKHYGEFFKKANLNTRKQIRLTDIPQ